MKGILAPSSDLRLGRPLPETLAKIEARKEREKAVIKSETEMAGIYPKDHEINSDILLNSHSGINDFLLSKTVLTPDHLKMMRSVAHLRYIGGGLMCESRPYTLDIDSIKIFKDELTGKREYRRCKILDIYTVNQRDQLLVRVDILLIDRGITLRQVPIRYIYDFPRQIEYYKDLETEKKPARLYLGESVPDNFEDEEINSYFCSRMLSKPSKNFRVKILDFKNEVYIIDILDNKNNSLSNHIVSKFREKFEKLASSDSQSSNTSGYQSDLPITFYRNQYRSNSKIAVSRDLDNYISPLKQFVPLKVRQYNGILHYLRDKLKESLKDYDPKKSFLQKRFIKVKVLSWCDLESFSLIPHDDDYLGNHDEFKKEIDEYQEKLDKENKEQYDELQYKIGQYCLFKNLLDLNLGIWLRGIIIDVPSTKDGILKHPSESEEGPSHPEKLDNHNLVYQMVYRVRSIDYGFQCVRSPLNLRPVKNESLFTKMGPWSLRCKLFGVYPFNHHKDSKGRPCFTDTCLSKIDSWMREKIMDDGKFAFFYVLFRTDIRNLTEKYSINPAAEITLFHRYEPVYRLEDCIKPKRRKSRFDCLNVELVDEGLADSHINGGDKSSNVDLDYFIVNLLVPHDRI